MNEGQASSVHQAYVYRPVIAVDRGVKAMNQRSGIMVNTGNVNSGNLMHSVRPQSVQPSTVPVAGGINSIGDPALPTNMVLQNTLPVNVTTVSITSPQVATSAALPMRHVRPVNQTVSAMSPSNVAYNVEHLFEENGKEVRKIPIKIGSATLWVDCCDDTTPVGHNVIASDISVDAASPLISPVVRPSQPMNAQRLEIHRTLGMLSPRPHTSTSDASTLGKTSRYGVKRKEIDRECQVARNQGLEHSQMRMDASDCGNACSPSAADPALSNLRVPVVAVGPDESIMSMGSRDLSSPAVTAASSTIATPESTHLNQIIYRPGFLCVCKYCGDVSPDFNHCSRCKQKLPDDAKVVPDPEHAQKHQQSVDSTPTAAKRPTTTRCVGNSALLAVKTPSEYKRTRKPPAKSAEPVCISLSSDDEDDSGENGRAGTNSQSTSQPDSPDSVREQSDSAAGQDATDRTCWTSEILDRQVSTTFTVPSFQIGSHIHRHDDESNLHRSPVTKLIITDAGLHLTAAPVESGQPLAVINIRRDEILACTIYGTESDRSSCQISLSLTDIACARARHSLAMFDPQVGIWFDQSSSSSLIDEPTSHFCLTLRPDRMTESSDKATCHIVATCLGFVANLRLENGRHCPDCVEYHSCREDKAKWAAQMELFTNTRESRQAKSFLPPDESSNTTIALSTVYCRLSHPLQASDSVAVTAENYYCLEDELFLNDVIVDFYMRFIFCHVLSERDRSRTHIFSTYFYKRLTTKPKPDKSNVQPITVKGLSAAAAARYQRVKRWTKNVNLFDKDFIAVPINENAHWFLVIICFARLAVDKIKSTNASTVPGGKRASETAPECAIGVPSSSPFPLLAEKNYISTNSSDLSNLAKCQDLADEADASDSEMISPTVSSVRKFTANPDSEQAVPKLDNLEKPCILVFDSLATGSRARVVATLRDYLSFEFAARHQSDDEPCVVFNKDNMPGHCPPAPQQPNFSDCGLYLLQYFENFFTFPITDFGLPIRSLKKWFVKEKIRNKRLEISDVIQRMADEQNPGKCIKFPSIRLMPAEGSGYSDDEDIEKDMNESEVCKDKSAEKMSIGVNSVAAEGSATDA